MEHRLTACSHYCSHRKDKLYHPNKSGLQKIVNDAEQVKKNLLRSFARSPAGRFLRRALAVFPEIYHKRYCSNNSLGIYLITSCNLSCYNCQASARQAPANDMMTVEQMKKIIGEAIELKYYWNAVFLTGGEPTLHPQLFEILDVVKEYRDFNPECVFIFETNGAGERVQSVLKKLPDWIVISNTNKKEGQRGYDFFTYNIAPVDIPWYKTFSDFSKGCKRIASCYGLCVSMYGYYPHTPCMNVDRVFGFDIGIKKLSLVTEEALREQMKILCQYCGWFREQQIGATASADEVSASWKKAFEEYKKHKPTLSRYA